MAVLIGAAMISIAACACIIYKRLELQNALPQIQRDEQADPPPGDACVEGNSRVSSPRDSPLEAASNFSLPEIKEATSKFKKKIGSGGFGVVYHGQMKNGREIAVKVLSNNSKHGEQEFLNEVNFLYHEL